MRLASVIRWSVRGLAAAALLALATLPSARADSNKGKYSQLTADWWQWVYSLPVSENPLFDETGADAYNAQPEKKVFFLAGVSNVSNTVERSITIPAGTTLFGPVLNYEDDNVGRATPLTVPQLRAEAAALIDSVDLDDLFLKVDGVDLTDRLVDRIQSPTFSYVLPKEDNIYQAQGINVSGRIKPAVSDGYWFYIPPLSAGEHTVQFGGAVDLDGDGTPDFVLNVTYHITVTRGK
jgi:hypothetical protein